MNAGGRQVGLDDDIQMKQVKDEICDYQNGMMMVLQYFLQPIELPPSHIEYETFCKDASDCNNNEVEVFGETTIAGTTETSVHSKVKAASTNIANLDEISMVPTA